MALAWRADARADVVWSLEAAITLRSEQPFDTPVAAGFSAIGAAQEVAIGHIGTDALVAWADLDRKEVGVARESFIAPTHLVRQTYEGD